MANDNLKQRAFSGVLWDYANHFGTLLIGIVPSMILARLLTPSEYGLIAMAGIFNALAFALSDGGFNSALLQRKDATHLDKCSIFYTNIGINTFFYLVFFFLAPYCAEFFNEPRITLIIRISLLSMPLVAIGGVHSIILKKEMNFKAPAIRNFVVQSLAAIIAIILAYCGCGVWSLVVQGVFQTLGNSIVNCILCSWRPTLQFSFASVKSMFSYGIKIYIYNLTGYAFSKAIDTTIAKTYTPADLSYYNRAYSTANLFINSVLGAINNVAFPTFANMQGDKNRLKAGLSKMVSVTFMVTVLMMSLLFVMSEPLFNFMYSSKWNAVIPLFQIVCVWGISQSLQKIFELFLGATGCAGIIMYMCFVSNGMSLAMAFLAWYFSIPVLLVGQICIDILKLLIYSYFTHRFYKYNIFSVVKDSYIFLLPTFCTALIAFGVDHISVEILSPLISSEFILSAIRIFLSLSIAISFYIVINRIMNLPTYRDLVTLSLNVVGAKNQRVSELIRKIVLRESTFSLKSNHGKS